MSTVVSTPERSTPTAAKPPRVLACVLCQQRKVKCDRKFPCANCVGSRAQCVPAAAVPPRQRRRRFQERELLDRLSRYESLLRQNNIKFEPLHRDSPSVEKEPHYEDDGGSGSPYDERPGAAAGADRLSSPSMTPKSETVQKAKNYWHAMNQRSLDSDDDGSDFAPDEVRETVLRKAWSQSRQSNDRLLFGSRKTDVDLSTLQPEQIQIFRLWQIYLDNVNPLLKVTHTPTLQGRIIEAASNLASTKPTLVALMFSIYCVSVLSLLEDECITIFGAPREQLLRRYQLGCQQALLNCSFLHSSDRDSLTAFYFYLISVRPDTDPHSLSSMLGLAIRIAQRMGLHSESAYANCPALEAEMRRRLWWSLILFDTRICEMADYKAVMLTPTWDCRTPLNVNDFDLQPEMKVPPAVQGKCTEALYAVVRSEMGEFVRHSAFHLDFINPALKTAAKDVQHGPIPEGGELVALEKTIEDKYLKFCNPENPLHFMTIWTARGYLAKHRLAEHFSRFSRSSVQQPTEAQRNTAVSHARSMIECDTKLMTSLLSKGYLWLIIFHFPFPAYVYICQDLRRRPVAEHAEQTWEVMSDNHEARFHFLGEGDTPWFTIFAKVILQAWKAREEVFHQSGNPLVPPRIISQIRRTLLQTTQDEQQTNIEQSNDISGTSADNFSMFMPMDFGGPDMLHSLGGQDYEGSGTGTGIYPGQAALDIDMNQFDWNTMYWNPMDLNPMHGRRG